MMRDSRIESLMVIGYNPSHSNINSEVNAPFKILSTLLRFLDTEEKDLGAKGTSLAHRQADYSDEEEEKAQGSLTKYKMDRNYNGERLDTVEGKYDLYDPEDEASNSDD